MGEPKFPNSRRIRHGLEARVTTVRPHRFNTLLPAQSRIQSRKSKITTLLFPTGDAGGDAFDDLLVDAAPDELLADADGVPDRAGVAAAVADQAVAADAQQRGAAVLL